VVIRCLRLGTTNVTSPNSGAANFAFLTTPIRYLTNYLASFELKTVSPSTGLSKRRQYIVGQRRLGKVQTLHAFRLHQPIHRSLYHKISNAARILSYMTMHAAAVAAAVSKPPAPIAPAVAACFIDTANISSALGPCCTYIGR
jgi:hypothetical protein